MSTNGRLCRSPDRCRAKRRTLGVLESVTSSTVVQNIDGLLLGVHDTVSLHLGMQCRATETQQLSGVRLIAVRPPQRFFN